MCVDFQRATTGGRAEDVSVWFFGRTVVALFNIVLADNEETRMFWQEQLLREVAEMYDTPHQAESSRYPLAIFENRPCIDLRSVEASRSNLFEQKWFLTLAGRVSPCCSGVGWGCHLALMTPASRQYAVRRVSRTSLHREWSLFGGGLRLSQFSPACSS